MMTYLLAGLVGLNVIGDALAWRVYLLNRRRDLQYLDRVVREAALVNAARLSEQDTVIQGVRQDLTALITRHQMPDRAERRVAGRRATDLRVPEVPAEPDPVDLLPGIPGPFASWFVPRAQEGVNGRG